MSQHWSKAQIATAKRLKLPLVAVYMDQRYMEEPNLDHTAGGTIGPMSLEKFEYFKIEELVADCTDWD